MLDLKKTRRLIMFVKKTSKNKEIVGIAKELEKNIMDANITYAARLRQIEEMRTHIREARKYTDRPEIRTALAAIGLFLESMSDEIKRNIEFQEGG